MSEDGTHCHKLSQLQMSGQKRNRRHHAHAAEDDEHDHEKTKEEDSSEEYVLISSLTGTVTHGSDT